MEIIYRIINFVVLFGVLGFLCRNIIKRIFGSRREKIKEDLEEAKKGREKAAKLEKDIEEEKRDTGLKKTAIINNANKNSEKIISAGYQQDEDAADEIIKKATAGAELIRDRMLRQVESHTMEEVSAIAGEVLKDDDFKEERLTLNKNFVEKIKDVIRAMPSDILKMKSMNKLNVSITSAEPATNEEMKTITNAIAEAFLDCKNEVDASLVGGIKMKIGDTVYDGSVEHQLEKLNEDVEKNTARKKNMDKDIREHIENIDSDIDIYQTGYVETLGDGIARVSGLSDCMAGEMLDFPDGLKGMVHDLDNDHVGVILLGDYSHVEEGTMVKRTEKILEVPVGESLIGRVVSAVGEPIDGEGPILTDESRAVESPAPTVVERKSVSVPLQTGLKAIDSLVPIGRGQRELIIGDRQTGKTAIALDAIINQKNKGVICIYVAIGQKESTVASVVEKLREYDAMDHTIVVSANASEPAPMLYIAPYSAAAMGEYFMYKGKDVLIVYDDLSKQAAAYRELSLLLQRPPGREAYPGDVFYLHSRLLERAARLSDELGGGSMTALPIIETQAGDISAYIPTNVISITDGQIFLEQDLFHAGIRPAINVGLSVSRVGGAAQLGGMKQIASRLRMDLAQYRELASFARFGADLDKATLKALNRGEHMTEILKQEQYKPMSVAAQVLIIYAGGEGFTDDIPVERMAGFESELIEHVKVDQTEIYKSIRDGNKIENEQKEKLNAYIKEFKEAFMHEDTDIAS